MTTSESRPARTALIGSHCPCWKSSCPNRSTSIRRAAVLEYVGGGITSSFGRFNARLAERPQVRHFPRVLFDPLRSGAMIRKLGGLGLSLTLAVTATAQSRDTTVIN